MQHALNEPNNTNLGMHHLFQKLHHNAISEYFFWLGQWCSELGYRDSMEGWQTSCYLLQVLGTRSFSMVIYVSRAHTSSYIHFLLRSWRHSCGSKCEFSCPPPFQLKREMSLRGRESGSGVALAAEPASWVSTDDITHTGRASLGTSVSVAWSVSHTHTLGPPEVTCRLRGLFLHMHADGLPHNHLRVHLRAFSGPRSMLCPLVGRTETLGS